ncbi:MAG TPA: undecaprenyl-phosphate glucose phosphotransferase [Steroidobacteraceae bacterium]|nr:undecaprenyl-phosphate glucose phosphotransferase [Steroidobacteraceae bacterium]
MSRRLARAARGRNWVRAGAGERPALALIKELFNPSIVVLALLLSALLHDQPFTGPYRVLAVLAFIVAIEVMGHPRLEPLDNAPRLLRDMRRVIFQWSSAVALLLLLGFMLKVSDVFSRKVLFTWFLATPAALVAGQIIARRTMAWLVKHGTIARRHVVVGANELGCELAARLAEDPSQGVVQGFFDDRAIERLPGMTPERLLGRFRDLADYVRSNSIHVIYICLPISAQPRIQALLEDLRDTTASIYFVPDLFAFDLIQARFGQVKGLPLVAICETPFCGLNGVIKRSSDIVLTSIALLLTAPLMIGIAIAVRRSSPGPILFRQRRYGLEGEEFQVYKFRTMTVCEDGVHIRQAQPDDPRTTRVGRFLRRTSLDELPQLFNVLEGTMSLVGPRPHAVAHNERYRRLVSGYMLRHKVRPGITGWAQVNGLRGETANVERMAQRVQFDLDYLRHWSLGLDLRILLRTAYIVLRDRNAY